MKKRFSALALIAAMILAVTGCGSSANTADNADKSSSGNSSVSSHGNSAEDFVGRWEQCQLNNSDEESFEQYDAVTLDWEKRYIELYSNGKGVTNYYVGDYCNGDSVVFEWEVVYDDIRDKDILYIYYAVEEDECDEFGFRTMRTWPNDMNFKDAKIEGKQEERNATATEFESPVDTVSFRFFDSEYYMPFVKVDNFTDNPDLGCGDAFKSIESYRADPDTYEAQFK